VFCCISISSSSMAAVPDDVQAVFNNNTCLDCHSGGTPSGNLSLDDADISETQLVNVVATCSVNNAQRVEPGEPQNSVLYQKLANQNINCGGVMPPTGDQVSDSELQTIFDWIISIGTAGQFGLLEMRQEQVAVEENDATVIVNIDRLLGSQGQVTVDFQVASVGLDSAEPTTDYIAQTGTLTFEDSELSKEIVIELVNDQEFEGEEVFSVTLSNPTGGAVLGSTIQTKIIINDDEEENLPGTLIFDRTSFTQAEDTANFEVTILRTFGTAGQITVDIVSSDVTAEEGVDYQSVNQTLVFLDGEQNQRITVALIDDQIEESEESFSLNMSNSTGGAITGSPANLTVNITDNDAPDDGDSGDGSGNDGEEPPLNESEPSVEAEYEAAGSLNLFLTVFLLLLLIRREIQSKK